MCLLIQCCKNDAQVGFIPLDKIEFISLPVNDEKGCYKINIYTNNCYYYKLFSNLDLANKWINWVIKYFKDDFKEVKDEMQI